MKASILEEFNPVIDIDTGECLYDVIQARHILGWSAYVEFKNGEFVEHIYASKETKKDGFCIREVMRKYEDGMVDFKDLYYVGYGMNSGLHAIWECKNVGWYGGYQELFTEWKRTTNEDYLNRMYLQNIQSPEEIIAMNVEALKYSGYDGSIDFMRFYSLYKKYPIAEMVMKLHLDRFLTEKSLMQLTEEKAYRKYIYDHVEEIKNQRLSAQWTHNAYKRKVDAVDYSSSLGYRIQIGRELAEGLEKTYELVKQYTTQEKLYKYLKDNDISKYSYADYIEACRWLRLNFEDTKVLFPRNFQEVHDAYTEQYGKYKEEQEQKRKHHISDAMADTAKKYGFVEQNINGFKFVIAKSKNELIIEGSNMNHCVGKMNYDERQAKGDSMIVFMRKLDDISKSYVTIELGKNMNIKQEYAKNNTTPEEKALETIGIWQELITKKFKKLVKAGALC